ncbi:hypothetical protein KR059_005451 [Drosophila kikkawai]|nr:hypothetical protein KR059_005451 [Drosophila kikkawai]
MPSVRYSLQINLLLSILLLTSGQRSPPGRVPAPPRQDLQTPNFDGESFERFGGGDRGGLVSSESQESSEENSAEMREQLKQLLGEQLANAFAPLATTPFSPPSTARRPGIIAPSTGAEARAQFAQDPESNEEEDGEGDEEESPEENTTPQPQPQPQPQPPSQPQLPGFLPQPSAGETEDSEEDYNPWRDNFYDLNEDGSYIFGQVLSYAIPHGVRRWEKGYYSEDQHGRVVEGFYVQPRHLAQGLGYELRCYIADSEGYHALPVEFLIRPPRVQRDEEPQVNCFNSHRKRI